MIGRGLLVVDEVPPLRQGGKPKTSPTWWWEVTHSRSTYARAFNTEHGARAYAAELLLDRGADDVRAWMCRPGRAAVQMVRWEWRRLELVA